MKAFLDADFLLNSESAKILYHDYAAKMPIIDYHCHVSPMEIARNRRFSNITQAWLGGDHYKWRLIRASGESEKLVTGSDSSDYEKFLAFARALPKAIGNPVYHWTHLELQRYFNCDLTLSPDTADEIWALCNKRLSCDDMDVRGIIAKSKVNIIATTDDPLDSLEWHEAISADESVQTKVLPTFRPDKAVNIDNPEFKDYIQRLGEVFGAAVKTLDDLFAALESRLDLFGHMGCVIADHGLDYVPFVHNSEARAPGIFEKTVSGAILSDDETAAYKTAMLIYFGRQYAKRGWTMQLHYGAIRNVNTVMFKRLGPDTGFDAISSNECSQNIASLLDHLEQGSCLPKTILYSLNPNDDAMLMSVAGCFPGDGVMSRVQHGSAWWFNDSKQGMEAQLTSLANKGLLSGFIGMLTDSRSFFSYVRHEYFRRVLCSLIGDWIENGEHPNNIKELGEIVQDISYSNAVKYFGFNDEGK